MKIYKYNELGLFSGTTESEFLPALATLDPPPEAADGHDVRFLNGEWRTIKIHIPTAEELEVQAVVEQQLIREEAKQARQSTVDAIKVTVSTGKVFDGDETSQGRMARAIIGLQATGLPSITWVLADNTSTQATLAELTEAMILAGQAQAEVWVI